MRIPINTSSQTKHQAATESQARDSSWKTMSTLSFTSHFCSPRAPPVKASDARQVACTIRARQLACIFCNNHQVLTGRVLRQVAGFLAPAFHANKLMRLDARHRWMNTLAIPSTPSSNNAVEKYRRWQTMSALSFISDIVLPVSCQ